MKIKTTSYNDCDKQYIDGDNRVYCSNHNFVRQKHWNIKMNKLSMNKIVVSLCLGTLLWGFSSCFSKTEKNCDHEDEQQLLIGDSIAIAQTQYGKVRGYVLRGVYTFCGIPYGASTSGENRFMPPKAPKVWEGIRPAVFWGDSAPQVTAGKYRNDYSTFTDHWNYYDVSEDCLMLNVWTKALADNKKRPVLVWLHGGGFTNGNGIEQDSYNGENITRLGDIVFVSLNHRLGPIGFSDFSATGNKKFLESGNVGVLDMVAALRWVHNNIENFGGDPDNVTIMGQSGGGAKVCTLIAMAETKGLIHKGVALSGNITTAINNDYSATLGKYILKEAGLQPTEIEKLQEMPWLDYIDLANRAAAKFDKDRGGSGMMRGAFGPVGDGFHIPMDTFYSDKHSPSNEIPMLFCTTTCEFSMSRNNSEMEKMDREQLVNMLKELKGDNAEKIVSAYQKAFPNKKPIELLGLIMSSRDKVIAAANAKAKQEAPVFLAWFGWEPPLFDGRMRAFHCLDISFWLKNTDEMLTHTGGGKRPRALSDKMSKALLSFMRTGNPNCEGLPEWPVYTSEKGATMMLNDICEVVYDPDKEARETLK